MLRSCGDAASRHASRSASGIAGSTSSSASVVPAPITPSCTPRGTTPRTSTSRSASSNPSRSSGTTSEPPCRKSPPSRSSTLDGRRSSTLLLLALALLGLAQRAQHLLAGDRQLVHVGSGRVADRVRDRGGDRDDRRGAAGPPPRGGDGDDRRLAEPLRAEVREVLVGPVDELADDLRHIRDGRHPVRIEGGGEDSPRLGVEQPLLRERV